MIEEEEVPVVEFSSGYPPKLGWTYRLRSPFNNIDTWTIETNEQLAIVKARFAAWQQASVPDSHSTLRSRRLPQRLQKYAIPDTCTNLDDANWLLAYYCALWQESQELAMRNLVVRLVGPENIEKA